MGRHRKGGVKANKDFEHLRGITKGNSSLKRAIRTFVSGVEDVTSKEKDPRYLKGYRNTMNKRWEAHTTGADWKTKRIPGLKLREARADTLNRARSFLEEVNGKY